MQKHFRRCVLKRRKEFCIVSKHMYIPNCMGNNVLGKNLRIHSSSRISNKNSISVQRGMSVREKNALKILLKTAPYSLRNLEVQNGRFSHSRYVLCGRNLENDEILVYLSMHILGASGIMQTLKNLPYNLELQSRSYVGSSFVD